MAEVTLTEVLPASVERVWEVVTDLTRWDWRRDLQRISVSGESGFCEVDRSGIETNFTITNWEPLVCWEFDIDNVNISGHWTGLFQAVPEGTRVTFIQQAAAKKLWMRPMVKGFLEKRQAEYLEDLRKAL